MACPYFSVTMVAGLDQFTFYLAWPPKQPEDRLLLSSAPLDKVLQPCPEAVTRLQKGARDWCVCVQVSLHDDGLVTQLLC